MLKHERHGNAGNRQRADRATPVNLFELGNAPLARFVRLKHDFREALAFSTVKRSNEVSVPLREASVR
jgi:hypothetical protein